MFCEYAKPRAGVAKMPSDGEELFVTAKVHKHKFFPHMARYAHCAYVSWGA